MLQSAKITLTLIDATTEGDLYYSDDEIKEFGFEGASEFRQLAVFVSFRVVVDNQAFPLRIWLRRDEAPEDQWLQVARKKAVDVIMWTKEAVDRWR